MRATTSTAVAAMAMRMALDIVSNLHAGHQARRCGVAWHLVEHGIQDAVREPCRALGEP